MAKSKPKPRGGLKVPLPVLILVVLLIGGVWYWLANRETVESTPTWSDTEAGTTPIKARLESFRSSWNAADLDAVRALALADVSADPEDESVLDRRVRQNGWDSGLPTIGEPTAQRKDPERYTVTWPIDGVASPMTTFWEWRERKWYVVSWIIPRVE